MLSLQKSGQFVYLRALVWATALSAFRGEQHTALTKKPSACSASPRCAQAPSVGSHKQAQLWIPCSPGPNSCPLRAWLFRSQSQDLTNITMFFHVLLCKSKWIYSLINMPQNASLPKLRNPCRISPKPHEKCLVLVLQFQPLSLSI